VQQYVEGRLLASNADIIFFDDGSGEAADYVTVRVRPEVVEFEFFHCKASGGQAGGDRVDDAYEVCGQAVKGLIWINSGRRLIAHAKRRLRRRGSRPSKFLRGGIAELEASVDAAGNRSCRHRMVIVQPGLSRSNLTPKIANVLAAADDFVRNGGCEDLLVLASE
jgi:hypothetical protein